MCGISVIVSKENYGIDRAQLKSMNNKIIHRGPDDEGYYYGDNFGFGFRRLSILDLTPLGHQPMEFKNIYVIIYNGEVYNYLEIRKELEKEGYIFISRTDTEVILASYDLWGEQCVKKFNGMWSFVIFDKKKEILFCSRDRYGIKPFNYISFSNKFLVGSEIKQFTVFDEFQPKINFRNAIQFLAKASLNTNNETIFQDVKELPSGSNLIYNLNNHNYKIEKYYDQTTIKTNNKISYYEAVDEFIRLFKKAVSIRLRSDVKIGSCLSGGLDSSSIISVAKGITSDNFTANTISSCYQDERFDEQEFIDEVTKYTGYNALKVFPDLDDLLEKGKLELINYHQDQPILGASHFSEFSVFDAAKKNCLTVMLDGQGADEFLAGYLPFPLYNFSLLRRFNLLKLLKELYFQYQNHYSLMQIIQKNLGFIKSRLFVNQINNQNINEWFNKSIMDEFISNNPRQKFNSYKELSLYEIQCSSIPYQLHSEDRNSMANSIESRLPFLDFDLTDFMYSLPDNFKIKDGTTKAVLRDALKEFLPEKIRKRHSKMGFIAPDEQFIRNNNKKVEKIIDNAIESSNGLLKPSLLIDFNKMTDGINKYNQVFFRILSFYFWGKAFNVSISY